MSQDVVIERGVGSAGALSWRSVAFATLAACALAALALWLTLGPFGLRVPMQPPLGGDFELQTASGTISSKALRGNVLLLYFGYTFCPDVCPTTLSDMARAFDRLPVEDRRRVRGIFVSVDPERDDLSRLEAYAGYFGPQVIGATAPLPELHALVARYGATFRRTPLGAGEGYAVEHPSSVYVIDKAGELTDRISHGASQDAWHAAIQTALHGPNTTE